MTTGRLDSKSQQRTSRAPMGLRQLLGQLEGQRTSLHVPHGALIYGMHVISAKSRSCAVQPSMTHVAMDPVQAQGTAPLYQRSPELPTFKASKA